MKSHRVLRFDEIGEELCPPLEIARLHQPNVTTVARDYRRDVARQLQHGVERDVSHLVCAALDRLHARPEFFLGKLVARLAGAVEIEHRALHVMSLLKQETVEGLSGFPSRRQMAVASASCALPLKTTMRFMERSWET